jgi:F0F1-type ATP synthase membrane subunit b/b'
VYQQSQKVGQKIILFRQSNSDPAEDFSGELSGSVSDFYAAGMVSSALALHYGCTGSINVPGGMARQVVQAMERDMTGELATKSELQNVRNDLHNSIERCRGELKADLELLRQETKADIELLRQETKADIELLRQETKADIDRLRQETKANIDRLRQETKAEIDLLRQETRGEFIKVRLEIDQLRQEMHAGFALLRSEMQTMSNQMTIKLGSMMVLSVGLIVTLQKLL